MTETLFTGCEHFLTDGFTLENLDSSLDFWNLNFSGLSVLYMIMLKTNFYDPHLPSNLDDPKRRICEAIS
jgi:hypothetical protein